MRRQFVLDERTDRLLDELASDRAGNRSHVVREAIQLYAEMEARLDAVESEFDFQRVMERSSDDITAGRLATHETVSKRSRRKKRRG